MNATAWRGASASAAGSFSWFDKSASTDFGRLPLLADAMNGVARALTEGLGTLSASPGEVSYQGIRTGTAGTPLGSGKGTVLAIAQAPAWNTPVGLLFDQTLISAVVEAFFGGAGDDSEVPERDALSAIETRIADVIAEQLAEAMTTGFAEILPTRFALEPIRPKPDSSLLGKPDLPVLIATLVLHGIGRPAELNILIPQAALGTFVDRLVSAPEIPVSGPDPEWSERFEAEVSQAKMRLQASIDLAPMSLGDIARLQTGQVLGAPPGAKNNVRLSCAGDELFRCELGQSSGFYTLRIEELTAAAGSPSRKHR